MKWKWDQYLGGGHTTKKMAALMKGILSKLPSEYFGENIFVGASTMSKEEIRRRHTIGCDVAMWGTDYPHPEGHVAEHDRAAAQRLRRRARSATPRKMLGETAARCYGFDLDALRPIAERDRPDARRSRPGHRARHDRRRDPPRPSGGRTSTRCSGAADDAMTSRGKVAVVTGGANGIGRGIVEALLDEGARVVIADVEQPVLERTVAELAGSRRGDRHPHRRVRLRRRSSRSPTSVFERYGACHLLFNNAGVTIGRRRPAVGAGAQRLEVVLRRQRVRRRQRRARVRAAHDRVGRARRHREHVVGRRRHRAGAVRVGLRGEQGRDQLLHRVARAPARSTRARSCEPSVFYPSGGLLDTGLWTAQRNRPPELAREREHTPGPVLTFAEFRERLAALGRRPTSPTSSELGRFVVAEVKDGKLRHRPRPRRRRGAAARARRRDREGSAPSAPQALTGPTRRDELRRRRRARTGRAGGTVARLRRRRSRIILAYSSAARSPSPRRHASATAEKPGRWSSIAFGTSS